MEVMLRLNVIVNDLIDWISRIRVGANGLFEMFLTHYLLESQSNEPQEEK